MSSMVNLAVSQLKVGSVSVRYFYQVPSTSGGSAKWKKGNGPFEIRPGASMNFVVDATHKIRVYRNEGGFSALYSLLADMIADMQPPGPAGTQLNPGTVYPIAGPSSTVVTSGAKVALSQNDPLTASFFTQLNTHTSGAGDFNTPYGQAYQPPTSPSYRTTTASTVTTMHPSETPVAFDFNDYDSYWEFTGT